MKSIKIDCNYAGGNIKEISIEGNHVKLEQDLRDTTVWWWYWNFSVESLEAQEFIFEFINGEVVGPWGPAISQDGENWSWLGSESLIDKRTFRYRFEEAGCKIYFCFSLPYQAHHFERFIIRYQKHEWVERHILTVSEQGRSIPLLLIGNPHAAKHIMITGRHHACESTASYLIEGLLSYLLDQNSNLLNNYLFHVVPFVDLDGVENGDQGKSRAPHDHNRDYSEHPIYKSTAAIMNYVKSLDLYIALDFHCPILWGDPKWGMRDDFPFFVKRVSPLKEEIEQLGVILNHVTLSNTNTDKLVYDPCHDLEAGEGWNTLDVMKLPTCADFMYKQGSKLSCTFEFPYFGIGDKVVTQHTSRQFGADFARALEIYAEK